MPDCEYLPSCIFFSDRMEAMPATSETYNRWYCRGDHSQCARFIVVGALGPAGVPRDLFPIQLDRARELLAQHGKP